MGHSQVWGLGEGGESGEREALGMERKRTSSLHFLNWYCLGDARVSSPAGKRILGSRAGVLIQKTLGPVNLDRKK